MSKRSVLAGLLAALMLLSGCTLFGGKEEQPVPEEYQQVAVVEFAE